MSHWRVNTFNKMSAKNQSGMKTSLDVVFTAIGAIFTPFCFGKCHTTPPPLFLPNSAIVILSLNVSILPQEILRYYPENAISGISLIFYTPPFISNHHINSFRHRAYLITRFLNCWNVSRRSCCCNACLFNILLTMGKHSQWPPDPEILDRVWLIYCSCVASLPVLKPNFERDPHLVKTFGYILCQQLRIGDQNGYL